MGELEIVGAVIALVLLFVFALLTRERRHKRLRIGFFLERERFDEEKEEE